MTEELKALLESASRHFQQAVGANLRALEHLADASMYLDKSRELLERPAGRSEAVAKLAEARSEVPALLAYPAVTGAEVRAIANRIDIAIQAAMTLLEGGR